MSEYPPEVQAVLDAYNQQLADAVAAYRKSIAPPEPPEPFDVLIHESSIADLVSPAAMQALVFNSRPHGAGKLWRCTVTPVERVR